jgi:hypothetical protein
MTIGPAGGHVCDTVTTTRHHETVRAMQHDYIDRDPDKAVQEILFLMKESADRDRSIPPELIDALRYAKKVQGGKPAPANPTYPTGTGSAIDDDRRMLGMRLRIGEGRTHPFQHLDCARKTDGTAVVFVMVRDVPMTLEDDRDLFPSDTLISQLLLLKP